jgi:putative FmdB family regulatory protein
MPIFEYKCHQCGEKFEVLVYSHTESTVICANCGSESIERLFSSFASTASGSSSCAGSQFS